MDSLESGAIVVVDCMNPKEKLWGVLIRLDAIGAVVRGLDLNSVEDWLRQEKSDGPSYIGPSTVFIPVHRLQRVYLDESRPGVPSFADRYVEACGREASEVLLGDAGSEVQDS
jgi:hypothetical protein